MKRVVFFLSLMFSVVLLHGVDFPVKYRNYDKSFDRGYGKLTPHMYAFKSVYHMRYMINLAKNEMEGKTNTIVHTRKLADHTAFVITPALDHIYSKAIIDVRKEPQMIRVPKIEKGRYYSTLLTDQEHYVIYDVIRPAAWTTVMVVPQGWDGKRPKGVDVVVETRSMFTHLLIRTQVFTPKDITRANKVQDLWQDIIGLNEYLGKKPLPKQMMPDPGKDLNDILKFSISTSIPYPETEVFLRSATKAYDQKIHDGISEKIEEAYRKRIYSSSSGGFEHPYHEDAVNDPYFRVFCLRFGHLGFPVKHAYYELIATRKDGKLLTGERPFTLTVPYEPGVKEFWSITRYDGKTRLPVKDALDVLNAYNSEPDKDGNVTITYSEKDPKVDGVSHLWIPVPKGPYYLIGRYYGPKKEMTTLKKIMGFTKSKAPEKLTVVSSMIGDLKFKGGYPTKETVQKAYDQLDMQRATQVYLEFMPAMSVQSIFRAHDKDYGRKTSSDIFIYTEPGKGKSEAIGLTYNTESIYATAHTDLKKDGPTVIETPPNVLGIVNDGWQRWVTDLGNAGPDKGKGGKYLLLPPDYKGEVPKGYFVFTCPTYRNWVMVRGFVKDTGTGKKALAYYEKNFKIYPLESGSRRNANYKSISFEGGDTTHPRDISYFEQLHKFVQYESTSAFSAYQLGLVKALGIEKNKQFSPDVRMKKLLAEGIKIGDTIAKANAYANRLDGVRRYPDRKYEYLFIGGRHDFTFDSALWIDARTLFHYEAIVVTPAMSKKMVGVGSQYLSCYRDEDDNFLMGDHTYKLRLPKDIPVKNFWSVTAYHPDTRSLLQNGQDKPSVSSYDKPEINADGSVDVWFAPRAPKGKEKNWIKTIPGEGWEILLRLYGPLEPYFDKTWKPDDIVRIE